MLKTITEHIQHFINGPVSFAKGLKVTFLNLWRPKVTLCYPEEQPDLKPRFRGLHGLTKDPETGDLNCIGCQACARICPDSLIGMELERREGRQGRYPVRFTINIGPCCFCGLCSEVCPTPMKSLVMSSEFEWAVYDRTGEQLVLDRERLLEIGEREVERRRQGRTWSPEGELLAVAPEEQGNPYFRFAAESGKGKGQEEGEAKERPAKKGRAGETDEEREARIAAAKAKAAARRAAKAQEREGNE